MLEPRVLTHSELNQIVSSWDLVYRNPYQEVKGNHRRIFRFSAAWWRQTDRGDGRGRTCGVQVLQDAVVHRVQVLHVKGRERQ